MKQGPTLSAIQFRSSKIYSFTANTFRLFLLHSFLSILFLANSYAQENDFPYREFYPDVPILELEAAKKAYEKNEAVFVDIRSSMEFEAIHIKKAVAVDFSMLKYLDELQQVWKNNPGRKIIVYDNGISSVKSYICVQDAMDSGIKDIYAYDGGIQAWAEKYPQDILLLGEQLEDPAAQLIPYEKFLEILLDFDTFKQKIAASPNAKIIDARDPKQRVEKIEGLEKALPIPLNKFIQNIINKERMKEDQLFIFDQVGGQVRWLMYYLEKHNYENYYFLEGGATAVLNEQKYR